MIVNSRNRYVRKHIVGGGGIFDTIKSIVTKLTGKTVGDVAKKLLLSAATGAAKSLGERVLASSNTAVNPGVAGLPRFPGEIAAPINPPNYNIQPTYHASTMLPQSPPPVIVTGSAISRGNHSSRANDIISKYSGNVSKGNTTMAAPITIEEYIKLHKAI